MFDLKFYNQFKKTTEHLNDETRKGFSRSHCHEIFSKTRQNKTDIYMQRISDMPESPLKNLMLKLYMDEGEKGLNSILKYRKFIETCGEKELNLAIREKIKAKLKETLTD